MNIIIQYIWRNVKFCLRVSRGTREGRKGNCDGEKKRGCKKWKKKKMLAVYAISGTRPGRWRYRERAFFILLIYRKNKMQLTHVLAIRSEKLARKHTRTNALV